MPSPMTQGCTPLASLNGSVALTTDTPPGILCHRLLINATADSTVSVTTADGTTVSLGVLPSGGVYQFDIQFTEVSFSAGTAVGFYRVEG